MWGLNSYSGLPERLGGDWEASDSDAEAVSTEFNTSRFGTFLEVSKDKRSVRYTGNGAHDNDVGAIQGNLPVPSRCKLYYFEATVVHAGERGHIVIGFSDRAFKLSRQPGWEPNSYGYRASDGKKLHMMRLDDYSEPYTTGDTVGAGIHLGRQELFFTKNGKHLGVAYRHVCSVPLFPTIGMHSKNEHVAVNFGAEPFRFNLQGLIHSEMEQQTQAVRRVPLPAEVSHAVVREYLQSFGYGDTLRALDTACGGIERGNSGTDVDMQPSTSSPRHDACNGSAPFTPPPASAPNGASAPPDRQHLAVRQAVRQHIMAGALDKARELLLSTFPETLLAGSPFRNLQAPRGLPPDLEVSPRGAGGPLPRVTGLVAYFYFSCLCFIELIRQRKAEDAALFAQRELAPLRGRLQHLSDEYDEMLHDVMALIAYETPESSPVGALLDMRQREAVADVINAHILTLVAHLHQQPIRQPVCVLERLLKQLVATQAAALEENGGQGEPFRLSTHLSFPAGNHKAHREPSTEQEDVTMYDSSAQHDPSGDAGGHHNGTGWPH
ncbi:hypothetical protein WJX73_008447 [Symbiochloris irregularis]|uniref:B30.2/SPRY domain-containing protein n=1 Tax=Symbiochloris irregularis TaxID=706552 RepID=A0AAW1NVZ7_9CHLO